MKKHYAQSFFFFLFIINISNAQNNCLPFNGTDDNVNCGSNLNCTGNIISMEAWIYPTNFKTNVYDNTIAGDAGWDATLKYGYVFYYGTANGDLGFTFGYEDGTWEWATTIAPNSLTLNTWQHVAAVYNGSTVKLYVNGIEENSENFSNDIAFSTNPLLVASCPGEPTNRLMVGKIDELRIWYVERTGAEINQYMYMELAGTETGLQAYYKFNETSGLVLDDATSNNNDGALRNMTGNEWTATNYYGGTGTSADPYTIDNLNELHYLSGHSADWISDFEQTTNIDATATSGWDSGAGFSPIGYYSYGFRGAYNGNNFTIDALYINRPTLDYVGLFGSVWTNPTIQNLGVTNVNITGHNHVGALLGGQSAFCPYNISNCYSSGSIFSDGDNIGGLIGFSGSAVIQTCYSSCTITTNRYDVGGLVGFLTGDGIISHCYATGNINGHSDIGGLVGLNYGKITNSYAIGNVSGSHNGIGGLLGKNYNAEVEYCYSTGSVSGSSDVGGLIGKVIAPATCHYSFWDTETSGQSTSAGGYGVSGKTTAEMKRAGTFLSASWDFTLSGNIWAMNSSDNSGYPWLRTQGYTPSHIWLGIGGTSWATAGNWSEDSEPSAVKNIIVPNVTNDPIISNLPASPATGNNLTIENSGNLTIDAGKALTVNGNLSNSETMTVNSDAINGTGSLIINGSLSNSGTITSQRYLNGSAQSWHFLSAPVSGFDISGSDFVVTPAENYDFYTWYEPEQTLPWVNFKNTTEPPIFSTANGGSGNFLPGKGYLCAYNESNPTKTFSGDLNTGNITYQLKYTPNSKWTRTPGWNLIGNPYSSSINWNAANRSLLEDNYAYIYDPNKDGGAGYIQIDGGTTNAYIPPNQGFFVIAKSGSHNQDLTFTSSIQTHGNSKNIYKNRTYTDALKLKLSLNTNFDEALLVLRQQSSFDRDREDALKLISFNDTIPQIFTVSNDAVKLAVNSIPYIDANNSIPVGILLPKQGNYMIELADASGNFAGNNIQLEDKMAGIVYDLQSGAYQFASYEGEITDRFVLHFQYSSMEEYPSNIGEAIQVFSIQHGIIIQNPGFLKADVYIFNTLGQSIKHNRLNGENYKEIKLNSALGLYVVKIVGENFKLSRKVLIN